MFTPFVDLLLLIIVANGAPIVARKLLRGRYSLALDLGCKLTDGRRLFGETKTWRGLLASLLFTPLASVAMQHGWMAGLLIAVSAHGGDLFSSFVKRRLGLASSQQALLIDQVPESLFPALMLSQTFHLDVHSLLLLVVLFVISELLLSQLLFRLGIRRRPY